MASTFNQLRQARHDLKAEGLKILEVAAAERTPEQTARLDAIEAQVAVLDKDIDRAAKFLNEERAQATGVVADRLEMGADRSAARPWGPVLHSDATEAMKIQARLAGLGEFAIAVKHAAEGKGTDARLLAAATGMGEAIPSDGGFAVPMEFAPGIERDMFAGGELLSRVDARTVGGNSIAYTVVDESSRASTRNGGVLHYWVDEGTAPTASQFKLARVEMRLRKVGCLGFTTDELNADAAALGAELQGMFADELIFGVEDAITEGNGAGKPLGYTVAPCLVSVSKETGQTAATINTANLSKMWARMRPRSKANAVWLINGDCGPQLDMLSIPAGAGALEPRFVTYGPDGIMRIKGRPVIETEYCATLGTVGDIVLIDLSKYRLIRKGGVEQASSIHVKFESGEQTFRAFYRCDGQMMPRSPLTPFKGSNTLSPVVVLATRS